MRAQPRLDLAKLDAETTNLDLVIVASNKLDCAIGTPAPQIASAVHPRIGCFGEWIGNKTLGSQIVSVQIPSAYTIAADIQLTDHPDRHWRAV